MFVSLQLRRDMGSNSFLVSFILVTFLVITLSEVSLKDEVHGKCTWAQLLEYIKLSRCPEKYNMTTLIDEAIESPWKAVKQVENMCKMLSKSDYLGYVECRFNRYGPCLKTNSHQSSNHSAWYDVVCNSQHDRKCLQQLFAPAGDVQKCEKKNYASIVFPITENRPWLSSRCQWRHEVDKCIADAMEKCSAPTATLFRENLLYALHESCLNKTLLEMPIVG